MSEDKPSVPDQRSATGIAVSGSPFILSVLVNERMNLLMPGEEPPQTPPIPNLVVHLSWPLAAALHEMLGEALAAYQAQEGHAVDLPLSFRARPKP